MATYDYKCLECDGEIFEVSKSMTEQTAKHIHKKCGSICNQHITHTTSFDSSFPGSYRSTNPRQARW